MGVVTILLGGAILFFLWLITASNISEHLDTSFLVKSPCLNKGKKGWGCQSGSEIRINFSEV